MARPRARAAVAAGACAVTAALAAAGEPVFTCDFDGLSLSVGSTPAAAPYFPYQVTATATGALWLEGGTIAITSRGALLVPGAGLEPAGPAAAGAGADAALGAYTFLSVPWRGSSGEAVIANFTCYTDFGLAALTAAFPDGLAVAGDGPPPADGDSPTAVQFPVFSATAGAALVSDGLGFVEWAGEMNSYANAHGVGLEGFGGGRQSGPLLLFNASFSAGAEKPQAVVLGPGNGPGTHVAHQVLKVVPVRAGTTTTGHRVARSCGVVGGGAGAPTPIEPACYGAPHTDEVGANSAPGTSGGLVVQAGNATACCAACLSLGAACDSWVFDTDGTAGGSNCWPLLGIRGSKQGLTDRVLGINWDVPCAPQLGTDAAVATPSPGFANGAPTASADQCCVLCATLGASACAAWSFDAPSGTCYPLASFNGTAPSVARTFGVAVLRPAVLAAGVQGLVTALPPRFTSTWWLSASPAGLTDAVLHYGEALRLVAGLSRMPRAADPLRNLLTYWADNGAFYFDGYWPMFFNNATNTAADVFLALKAYHASLGLTIGSYQMDPWWYGGSCGADGPPPPQCHDPTAWPWAANWSAAPGFFPDGLGALGMPLTLYSNIFAAPPTNIMTQFTWLNSSCEGIAPCGRVIPEQSYDFHSYLFDVGTELGQNAFEVDFADVMFLSFPDFGTDVRAFDEYWAGLNAAAVEHGFPTQMCMSLPAHTLSSVAWPAVTNARLAGDGYATNYARYDIFQTSLLYAAVELAPFLDNIWTTSCQPALDNPFGNGTCEGDVEGLAAIAALSAGPVGFADRVGFTNATLVNMTARADGVLLHPSSPAVNLEFFYAPSGFPAQPVSSGLARVTTAPSFVPLATGGAGVAAPPAPPAHAYPLPPPFASRPPRLGPAGAPPPPPSAMWLTVFGIYVDVPITVTPADVWPALPPPVASNGTIAAYFVTALSRAAACMDGAPAVASGCAARFEGGAGDALVVVDTGPYTHEVFTVAPVFVSTGGAAGWALLGELGKFVRVSPLRVTGVDWGCGQEPPGLCVGLKGAPGEAVALAFVDPAGIIRRVSATVSVNGTATLDPFSYSELWDVFVAGAGALGNATLAAVARDTVNNATAADDTRRLAWPWPWP